MAISDGFKTENPMQFEGVNFRFDGQDAFYVGTHYYPSSVWIERTWRDFDTARAAQDFAAMRRAGNRIVRIWVDPYSH